MSTAPWSGFKEAAPHNTHPHFYTSILLNQVVASYEYYTMEWIQRQVKEGAPQKLTSFSQMDSRPR